MTINNIIYDASLEDILEKLRLQLLENHIEYLQIIKPGPKDIMCQCPYHSDGKERKPSFGIRRTDGLGHCFTCGEVHTLPEIISHCFGKNDVVGSYGQQWLINNFVTYKPEYREPIKLFKDKEEIVYVSEEELDSYRYYHPYMYKRGLNDEGIEMFDVGYDSKSKCVTFPVRDTKGRCEFIARRSVNSKFFNYPAGVKKPLYGLYEVSKCISPHYNGNFVAKEPRDLWLCESMIDCILLWQHGNYAVALNGLGNDKQFKQLQKLIDMSGFRLLVLATDNDEAGQKARQRIRENIDRIFIADALLPENRKDIGECTPEEIDNIKYRIFNFDRN